MIDTLVCNCLFKGWCRIGSVRIGEETVDLE